MSALVLTSAMTLYGTAFSTVGPGPGNPTVAGTITSATDFSDHVFQVSLGNKVAMQDFTTFGDGAFVTQKPGLKSSDIQIDFNQDFAASSVDAIFGAAQLAGTLVYLDFKPTSSARGTTNPSYVYAAYVMEYPPMGQSVGDRAAASVKFGVTGTYARLTS